MSSDSRFDAFSSHEPVSISLENAIAKPDAGEYSTRSVKYSSTENIACGGNGNIACVR
jgi:hypothetical protein